MFSFISGVTHTTTVCVTSNGLDACKLQLATINRS